jgi:hypothetical protein
LEPQRTNLLVYSSQFDNSNWIKTNITITPNAIASPDGYQNADKVEATTTGTTFLRQSNATAGVTGGMTFTCYAKKGSGANEANKFALRNNTTGTTVLGISIDYDTLAITYTNGSSGASVSLAPNGFVRISLTSTAFSSGDSVASIPAFVSASEPAGSFCYLYGCQLEAGAYPTSLIPSLGATATRNADACSKTGISSLIGQTEGTVFLHTKYFAAASSASRWFKVFGVSNEIALGTNGTNFVRAIINGLTDIILTAPKTDLGVKIAFAYNATGVVLFINGTEYSLPNGGSEIMTSLDSILFDAAANPQFQQGEVNSFILFKTRLTNQQLQELTSL